MAEEISAELSSSLLRTSMNPMLNMPRWALSFLLIAIVGLIAGLQSTAQSPRTRTKGVAIERLERLTVELTANNQTNLLAQTASVWDVMMALQHSADIGVTVAILDRLRSGRTNEAINLLEIRLDSALAGFGRTPRDARDPDSKRTVEIAKQYRAKFPRKTGVTVVDTAVEKALDSDGN